MINEDFKHKLSDYQESEPQGLWDDILVGLDAAKAPQKPLRKKNLVPIITLAATFTAAAAIVLGIFLKSEETAIVPIGQQKPLLAENQPIEDHPTEKYPLDKQLTEEYLKDIPDEKPGGTQQNTSPKPENPTIEKTEEGSHLTTTGPTEVPITAESIPVTKKEDAKPDEHISIYSEKYNYTSEEDSEKKHDKEKIHRKSNISIGLLADGVFKAGSAKAGYDDSFEYSQPYSGGTIVLNGLNVDPAKNIQNMNAKKDVTTRTRFIVPVRAGLAVRWKLSFGLGFETGLQYSYLNSITESGSAENFSHTENICHFIGIPLNISYSFWSNEYLDVYINVGALFEWQLSGSSVTTFYINNEAFGNEVTGEPPIGSPYQFSAGTSAGIQYNILPWLALYAEPGVTCFLNNEALYGDRPWNFSIRAGFRFDITRN